MWILNYNDLLFCSNKYHYLCDTHKINNGTSEHNMEQTMTIYGLTIFMNCPAHTNTHTHTHTHTHNSIKVGKAECPSNLFTGKTITKHKIYNWGKNHINYSGSGGPLFEGSRPCDPSTNFTCADANCPFCYVSLRPSVRLSLWMHKNKAARVKEKVTRLSLLFDCCAQHLFNRRDTAVPPLTQSDIL